MGVPDSWYPYVVPGIIILAWAIPIITPAYRKRLLAYIHSKPLESIAILGLSSYLAGFLGDTLILHFIRPGFELVGLMNPSPPPDTEQLARLYYDGKTDLVKTIWESYQGVVMRRTFFGALFVLLPLSAFGLWRNRKEEWKVRVFLLFVTLVACCAMCRHWKMYEEGHKDFSRRAYELSAAEPHETNGH